MCFLFAKKKLEGVFWRIGDCDVCEPFDLLAECFFGLRYTFVFCGAKGDGSVSDT